MSKKIKKPQRGFNKRNFQEFLIYFSRAGLIFLITGVIGAIPGFSAAVGAAAFFLMAISGIAAFIGPHPETGKPSWNPNGFLNKIVMPSSGSLSAAGALKALAAC